MIRNLQFAADAAARIGAIVLVEPLNTRDVPGTFVSNILTRRSDSSRATVP